MFYSTERLRKMVDKETATERLNRAFAALSDPTRRDLVARLAGGDATVGELAEHYDMSRQAVSKHVKLLGEAGLVTRTNDDQRRTVHRAEESLDLMNAW